MLGLPHVARVWYCPTVQPFKPHILDSFYYIPTCPKRPPPPIFLVASPILPLYLLDNCAMTTASQSSTKQNSQCSRTQSASYKATATNKMDYGTFVSLYRPNLQIKTNQQYKHSTIISTPLSAKIWQRPSWFSIFMAVVVVQLLPHGSMQSTTATSSLGQASDNSPSMLTCQKVSLQH